MLWWADHFFIQGQLRDMLTTEPAFTHCPALLEDRQGTPDQAQYDSPHDLDGEGNSNQDDAANQFGADHEESTGKETDASGWSNQSSIADKHHQINCAL